MGMILNTYHGTYSEWLEENKEIREMQKLVKRTPKSFTKFINKTVFAEDNYFFFNREKTGGHCSACSHDVEIKKGMVGEQKVKHKAEIVCPVCGEKLTCISDTHYNREGYRRKMEVCKWSMIVESKAGWLIFRYIRSVKTFGTKDGEIRSKEFYRTFWNETTRIETAYQSDPFDHGYAWVPYREPSFSYFGYWNAREDYLFPNKTYVFNAKKLAKVTAGTWAKYSGLAEYAAQAAGKEPLAVSWGIEKYLSIYKQHNSLEQLSKCGLTGLVDDLLMHNWKKEKLKDQPNICDTLDINREVYAMLRADNTLDFYDLEIIRDMKEHTGKYATKEEISFLRAHPYNHKFFYEFMQYKTLHKLKKYANRASENGTPIRLSDYRDYFEFLKELGVKLDSANLFPKDFKKAHDMRHKQVMELHNRIAQEKRTAQEKQYQKLLEGLDKVLASTKEFVAVYPQSLAELTAEGESLHHCVGSYAAKVASGETTIVFIRRVSHPDQSYYTMEVRDGRIIQVRGAHNKSANSKIMAFARKAARAIEQTKKATEHVA